MRDDSPRNARASDRRDRLLQRQCNHDQWPNRIQCEWPAWPRLESQFMKSASADNRYRERLRSRDGLSVVSTHPHVSRMGAKDACICESSRGAQESKRTNHRNDRDASVREGVEPVDDVVAIPRDSRVACTAARRHDVALRGDLSPVADRTADRPRVEFGGSNRVVADLPGADALGRDDPCRVRAARESKNRQNQSKIGDYVRADVLKQAGDHRGSPSDAVAQSTIAEQARPIQASDWDQARPAPRRHLRVSMGTLRVAFALILAWSAIASPAASAAGVETITTCGAAVFTAHSQAGFDGTMFCPGTKAPPGMSILADEGQVSAGARAFWEADAPTGLTLVAATIPAREIYSINVDDNNGWGGGFYWQGGGAQVSDSTTSFGSFMHSSYFGFQIICGWSTCNGLTRPAQITVETISLSAQETQGPWLVAPDGLWQTDGWVRGTWPLHFSGDSPSGLCNLSATLNGQTVSGAESSSLQNTSVWHQCAAPGVDPTVSTWVYGQGPVPLTLSATDAAGLPVTYTKTVHIDNSTPTVSFSGPSDAASTAGTQYVTAAAGGSPSGIEGLACSVDGAASQWYSGASATVPVNGVGQHAVNCAAANNAVDSGGNHGWSSWKSWTMKIGLPTVSTIGFERTVDALRCQRVKKRLRMPDGRARNRAHARLITVTQCHPRIVWRHETVWVTVRRHGREVRMRRVKLVRVVLTPHLVEASRRRVAYGRGTTVDGWVGTNTGIGLGGQPVTVLTAPDNDQGQFTQVAIVTTRPDGSWSASLPPGPSRLVEAVYNGTSTTEESTSPQVHLIVPARVKLIRIFPRRVAWGGTIHIVGQLEGGYLPAGGALIRLRIGLGSAETTYGVQEHVSGNGRFSTTYTFGLGEPNVYRSYWFQIASLPMGNYPFAPASSRRLSVLVGGYP
jgi:hypothetical protein